MESLYQYLASDHDRLDRLLDQTTAVPERIDLESYGSFRAGLLRHIAMEERTVFPAIARLQGDGQVPVVNRLRLDHGALSALLVPPPNPAIVATIRLILSSHNPLEEQDGGIYRLFEQFAGAEAGELLEKLKSTPEVRLAPYNIRPEVLEATRRAVARAGYKFP